MILNRIVSWARHALVTRDTGWRGAISGRFDLSGDSLVGTVETVLNVSQVGVEIRACLNGKVVARCHPEGFHGRAADFELPIDGCFSRSDLAREAVIVTAVNRRGDSGTLELNGATRMDLIREYLGVPVKPVFDLDFSRFGNSRSFLGSGWNSPGASYTWTKDIDSFINFVSPTEPGDYLLRIRAGAFIESVVTIQPMEIYLNNNLVAAFTENSPHPQYREFKIDYHNFEGYPMSVFRLNHPYAARPCDHEPGSSDTSRLAFSVRRIALVHVLASN